MIKIAINNIFKKFSLTLATIVSLTITLFIIGFMFLSYINIINISKKIDEGFKVVVNIDSKLDKTNKKDIDKYKKIEEQFSKIPEIKRTKFSSKNKELAMILKQDNASMLAKDIGGDNPLSDTYYLTVNNEKSLKIVEEKTKKIKNVESSSFGGNEILNIINKLHSWVKVFVIVSILLFILSVILVMNVIRVAIIHRKNEIEIMRLVGASNRYIKWPYTIESIILSLISSIISITLLLTTYKYLFKFFQNLFISNINILKTNEILGQTSLVIILVGILISVFASTITIRRFIKI